MAVAFNAVTSSAGTFGNTLSFSHEAAGSDRAVVIGVAAYDGSTGTAVSGVTYGGVACTQIVSSGADATAHCSLWGLIAPATGSQTVAITLNGNFNIFRAGATSVTGADQTTLTSDSDSSLAFQGSPVSLTLTSAVGELVVDVVHVRDDTGAAVGASQTERWKNTDNSATCGGSTEPGGASVTMSWTFTSTRVVSYAAAAIKAAAAGGGFQPAWAINSNVMIGTL